MCQGITQPDHDPVERTVFAVIKSDGFAPAARIVNPVFRLLVTGGSPSIRVVGPLAKAGAAAEILVATRRIDERGTKRPVTGNSAVVTTASGNGSVTVRCGGRGKAAVPG